MIAEILLNKYFVRGRIKKNHVCFQSLLLIGIVPSQNGKKYRNSSKGGPADNSRTEYENSEQLTNGTCGLKVNVDQTLHKISFELYKK